ncbi:uncharacterized protein LOC130721539 [Lotus japonicus]|uniref:uncharacterized protein LOC130721539 n=1 Tax=Lotus japonicus TaxID=34305 RepID=UPI002586BCEB|nr:uncharacterized protein LOC130721539 [Lotus japonicus]
MTVVIQNSNVKASTLSQKWSLQQKQQQQSLKKKQEEEAMKFRSVFLHSKSTSSEGENRHNNNNNNSCYYPDCKKNANCNCEICLASINATRDLMPMSIHKNSLTKLSVTRPKNVHCTPITFDASILSTPTTTRSSDWPYHYQISPTTTPVIESSSGSSDSSQMMKKRNKGSRKRSSSCINLLWFLLGLGFLLSAELVFSRVVSGILQPALSPDVVKRVGEKCYHVQGLNGKLRFLQRELTSSVVGGQVSNCSFNDTLWEINRDGLLLSSRCTLYKSAIEEVTIWGWPLQTAGLLTNGFSTRTQTILSGRVTEWNGGLVGYLTRKANGSWVQPKWGASVVQLDPNTWVLEYQRSSIVDGTRLYSAVLEFLKYRNSRVIGRLKKKFWQFAAFEGSHYNRFRANNGLKVPT